MQDEVFKAIPGFEGRYMVSDQGSVMTLDFRGKGKGKRQLLSPFKTGGGYCYVTLSKDQKRLSVHRLVMLTFVGPCPEGKEIDHINGDRTDNRLENLRYCTRQENIKSAVDRHGPWGCFAGKYSEGGLARRIAAVVKAKTGKPNYGVTVFTADQAEFIRNLILSGKATRKGLARDLGVSKHTIKGVVNGTTLAYR